MFPGEVAKLGNTIFTLLKINLVKNHSELITNYLKKL